MSLIPKRSNRDIHVDYSFVIYYRDTTGGGEEPQTSQLQSRLTQTYRPDDHLSASSYLEASIWIITSKASSLSFLLPR